MISITGICEIRLELIWPMQWNREMALHGTFHHSLCRSVSSFIFLQVNKMTDINYLQIYHSLQHNSINNTYIFLMELLQSWRNTRVFWYIKSVAITKFIETTKCAILYSSIWGVRLLSWKVVPKPALCITIVCCDTVLISWKTQWSCWNWTFTPIKQCYVWNSMQGRFHQ